MRLRGNNQGRQNYHQTYDEETREFSQIPSRGSRATSYERQTGRRKYRKKKYVKKGSAVKGAQSRLSRFKQASILAVALTSFLLILFVPEEAGYSQDTPIQEVKEELVEDTGESQGTVTNELDNDIGSAAKDEALTTIQNLWDSFYANLPKILVAIVILLLAYLLVRIVRYLMRRLFKGRQSSGAAITLVGISIWMLAIAIAVSVVAGDIRALLGSLGIVGLALSWSLQTPIESFTGYLMNSFKDYYRVGDRISVGDVFGDVYEIDFLTTTVWEIGAPFRPGFVQAEQPTGRLVTFPNNEILSGTVVNLTGDFPFVWDELAIAVANESEIKGAMEVLEKTAVELLGEYMKAPAQRYEQILRNAGLQDNVPDKPLIYISIGESWTDVIIRYLVGARERRKWKSDLSLRIMEELNKPEYSGKIKGVYPRQQVQIIKPDGMPEEPEKMGRID